MLIFRRHVTALGLATLLAVAAGCSNNPVPSQAAHQALAAPPQVQSGNRHVQSLDQPPTLKDWYDNLPARISVADADRLLVRIDPSKIQRGNASSTYQVQAVRGGGRMMGGRNSARNFSHNFRNFDRFRDFDRDDRFRFNRFFDFDDFFFNDFFPLSSFSYFPFGSFYYPYYLYGNYYYPFSYYNSLYYYPFLSGYGGAYNPYLYTSPYGMSNWGNFTSQPGAPAYGQPQAPQTPTPTPTPTPSPRPS